MNTKILLISAIGSFLASMTISIDAKAFSITASADFDSLPEGFIGSSFSDGGLTFSEGVNNPLSGNISFAIESTAPGMFGPSGPNFSPPNSVSLGAVVPGSEGNVGAGFKSTTITAEGVNFFAQLNFFALKNVNVLNTLTLEAYLDEVLVASDSSLVADFNLVQGSSFVGHRTFEISNTPFDKLMLVASGSEGKGSIFGGFDNVIVGVPVSEPSSVPEPSTILGSFVAIGACAVLKKKVSA